MNRSVNLNLEKLKKQLNNSTNVNVLKKPKKVVTRNVTKRVASVNKKPVKVTRVRKTVKAPVKLKPIVRTRTSSDSSQWDFLSVLLTIALLFFIGAVVYNIYLYLLVPQEVEQPQISIEDKVRKAPKGVIIDQEGAPISVEKGGDITENKYLSLYGGDDFIRQSTTSPWGEYSTYASYPGYYGGGYGRYNRYGPGYYSQTDDGVTKIYYQRVKDTDRSRLNSYIRDQNQYIKDINRRVRQINDNRMNTPTYSRDKAVLQEIRNYERRLANQVNREAKSQPYLPDQNRYYQ